MERSRVAVVVDALDAKVGWVMCVVATELVANGEAAEGEANLEVCVRGIDTAATKDAELSHSAQNRLTTPSSATAEAGAAAARWGKGGGRKQPP